MMVPINTEKNKTAYTVTLDYRHGTTTGISAHDRALSSRMLAKAWRQRHGQLKDGEDEVKPGDFCRPGHLCPLRYTEGGVRRRSGHTEASVGESAPCLYCYCASYLLTAHSCRPCRCRFAPARRALVRARGPFRRNGLHSISRCLLCLCETTQNQGHND